MSFIIIGKSATVVQFVQGIFVERYGNLSDLSVNVSGSHFVCFRSDDRRFLPSQAHNRRQRLLVGIIRFRLHRKYSKEETSKILDDLRSKNHVGCCNTPPILQKCARILRDLRYFETGDIKKARRTNCGDQTTQKIEFSSNCSWVRFIICNIYNTLSISTKRSQQ